MAADHVREGIRVNCVNPGTADTPWVGRLLDAADGSGGRAGGAEARQPMGRLVSADEVAAAIAYLASPLAGVHHRHGAGRRRRDAGLRLPGLTDARAEAQDRPRGPAPGGASRVDVQPVRRREAVRA